MKIDKIPQTMEEAVEILISSLTEEEKKFLINTNFDHHGFGRFIRNGWNFWQDSPFRRHCIKRWVLAHADDLSGMLFEWAEATIKGEEFKPEDYVARIQVHWANYNTTSCGAANLNEDGNPL